MSRRAPAEPWRSNGFARRPWTGLVPLSLAGQHGPPNVLTGHGEPGPLPPGPRPAARLPHSWASTDSGEITVSAESTPAGRPAVIRPLARPVLLQQSTYEAILEMMTTGQLEPGQHLVESRLARHLGVSRQPVHEALHRLESEGWVEMRPGRGAVVRVPTDQEVDDLLDVRELLEAEVARLVAGKITPGQVAWLRRVCSDGAASALVGDTEQPAALNNDFHGALAEITGNAALAALADYIARRTSQCYRVVVPMRGQEPWTEHVELLDAVEAGDQGRAAALARVHVDRARALILGGAGG